MANAVCTPMRAGRLERAQILSSYMQYLDRRDGETGPDGKTLSFREDSLHRLRAQRVRWAGKADAALFAQQYQRFSPERETPPEMLLLLAFVKINSHEAYSVDTVTRIRKNIPADEKRLINQERYHTHLLLSAADLFGVPVSGPAPPTRTLKVMTAGLARTPPWLLHPVTMCAELLGVAAFSRLLRATRIALRDQPELRDAMEERVMEVYTDEVGHLTYNRLRLGPAGMAAVKMMLPPLIFGFRNTLPELDRLCGGPMTVAEVAGFRFEDVPEPARARGFVA
jgi:hypothetical protein